MGKQTKQKGSHFGGEWTIQKLHIIDKYLQSYSTVLKNTKVKKIYVDGFAGSGRTELKSNSNAQEFETQENFWGQLPIDAPSVVVEGSALLSLKYDFDEYYFLELDEDRISMLKEVINNEYPQKISKVHFITGDSNEKLAEVVSNISKYDRCLMFLDPYALELKWDTLEMISKCGVIDLWYLFPLSLIRLIEKQKEISDSNRDKVTSILGTDDWLDKLFVESEQISMFDEVRFDRVSYDKILEYIKQRFSTIFPYVSPDAKILKNEAKNSPMFMLCFMMTNSSTSAQNLAARLVKGIINSTEKI